MGLDQKILVNILALDKGFDEYEFIHAYLGPDKLYKEAKKITVNQAYCNLNDIYEDSLSCFDDEPPYFRRTYVRDLIKSVITQAEHFIFKNKKKSFQPFVEDLMGFKTLPKFCLVTERDKLLNSFKEKGFHSVLDYKEQRKNVSFKNSQELSCYVHEIQKKQTNRVSQILAPLFHFDMPPLLEQSRLKVISAKKNDPPCFYFYRGGYKGTVGLKIKSIFKEDYLENFVSHECIPGHHLYYLIKEHYLKTKSCDLLMSIDPYYSPENLINEGLAVNADLLLDNNWDFMSLCMLELDKFMHKVYHNSWYDVNVLGQDIPESTFEILKNDLGLNRQDAKGRLHYFTHEAKYYTPSYSQGIHYVSEFIKKQGRHVIPLLYGQHSVNTLLKLGKYYDSTN